MERISARILDFSKKLPYSRAFSMVLMGVLSFFLGRIMLFGAINPAVISFVAACMFWPGFYVSLFMGILGVLTRFSPIFSIKYLLALGLLYLVNLILSRYVNPQKTRINAPIAGVSLLACGLATAVFNGFSTYLSLLAVLEGVLAFLLCLLIRQALNYLSDNSRGMGIEELIGLAVLGGGLIAGCGDIHLGYVSLRYVFCAFAMLIACAKGPAVGAAAGTALGLFMSLAGFEPPVFGVVMSLSGLIGGGTNGKKYISAPCYVAAMCMASFFLNLSGLTLPFALSLSIGGVLFVLLPHKGFLRIERPIIPDSSENSRKMAKAQLSQCITLFKKMAQNLSPATDPEIAATAIWVDPVESQNNQLREMAAFQLFGAASVLERLQRRKPPVFDSAKESELWSLLRRENIEPTQIYVISQQNRQKLNLTAEIHLTKRPEKDLTAIVSRALGTDMCLWAKNTQGSGYVLQFAPPAPFCVAVGRATATKKGFDCSGDSFLHAQTGPFQCLVAISDGMGSGLSAKQESSAALDILKSLTQLDINWALTVRLINSAMFLRHSRESFATLDICSVDLSSGTAEFLKIGSSPSFIIRRGSASSVASATLPMGILYNVDMETKKHKLSHEDFIIMVTDGVLDSINAAGDMELAEMWFEAQCHHETEPQAMADKILLEAKKAVGFNVKDDMTVVVVKLIK